MKRQGRLLEEHSRNAGEYDFYFYFFEATDFPVLAALALTFCAQVKSLRDPDLFSEKQFGMVPKSMLFVSAVYMSAPHRSDRSYTSAMFRLDH